MASWRTPGFKRLYGKLDGAAQRVADAAYLNYEREPTLVDFEYKGSLKGRRIYGAHITKNLRALAFTQGEDVVWYWIGAHTDYDRLLKGLSK